MNYGRRRDPEQGSATVEFVAFGVLLMLPLVYLVITMGRIQAAAFAADGGAREAARAFVTADDDEAAHRRAVSAVRLALLDQGFGDPKDGELEIECERAVCLTSGSRIVTRVQVRVVLPGVPRFIDRALSTSVTVRSGQTIVVDEFRPVSGEP
jgi:hypothetical protein